MKVRVAVKEENIGFIDLDVEEEIDEERIYEIVNDYYGNIFWNDNNFDIVSITKNE